MRTETLRDFLGRVFLAGFGSSRRAEALFWCLAAIVVLYPFSLLFVVGGVLPPEFSWTASVMIMLFGATGFMSELRYRPAASALVIFALTAGALFLVEWVGLTTGVPFGRYVYTGALGVSIAGIPVAIAVAWYATILTSWHIAGRLAGPRGHISPLRVALLGGCLTLALDILLEPFAADVNRYWTWEHDTVPLQNYLSWFVLGTGGVLLLASSSRVSWQERRNLTAVSALVYGLQFLLFAVTLLTRGRQMETLVAVAITAGVVLFARAWGSVQPAEEVPKR